MGLNYAEFNGAMQETIRAKIAANLTGSILPKRANASKLVFDNGPRQLL
jgi:hypothetical protein